MISPERLHSIELIDGKMLSLAARPNPNPSFGTQELEEDGRAWLGATGVAVLGVNAVTAWATRVAERTGIGKAKLGPGETRRGNVRRSLEKRARSSRGGEVDTEDRARETAIRAEGATMVGGPTTPASPLEGRGVGRSDIGRSGRRRRGGGSGRGDVGRSRGGRSGRGSRGRGSEGRVGVEIGRGVGVCTSSATVGRRRERKQGRRVGGLRGRVGKRVKEGVGIDGLERVDQIAVRLPSRDRGVKPSNEILITIDRRRERVRKTPAIKDAVDAVVVGGGIGVERRVDRKARNVEHIMEAAGGESGESIVVVGKSLDNSIRTVSGNMPLSDGGTIKLMIFDHHDALAGRELEPRIVGRVMGSLSGTSGRKQALADQGPTRVKAVDKGSHVRMNQGRRRLGAMVGNIEREREVATMVDVERRETGDGVNGGVVGDFKVRKVTSPTRIGSGDTTSEEKMAKGGIEAFGEANGLVMCGGRSFQPSTDS